MKKVLSLALPAFLVVACGDSGESPGDAALDATDAPPAVDTTDAPPAVDAPTVDGPSPTVDAPTVDGPSPTVDAPTVDGPIVDAIDRDLPTKTLWFPDGRTITVNIVDSCDTGALFADPRCPATYAEGLARAMTVDAGPLPQGTAAGQCAEGGYVYMPFLGLESKSCYYGPDGTTLLAINDCGDLTWECSSAPGTASNCRHHGPLPPCTNVTWAVRRMGYY
jgi:hypothetical protein